MASSSSFSSDSPPPPQSATWAETWDRVSSNAAPLYAKVSAKAEVAYAVVTGYGKQTSQMEKSAKMVKATTQFLNALRGIQRSTLGIANLEACAIGAEKFIKGFNGIVHSISLSEIREKTFSEQCFHIAKIFDGAIVLIRLQLLPQTQNLWTYAGRVSFLKDAGDLIQANRCGKVCANAIFFISSLEMVKSVITLTGIGFKVYDLKRGDDKDKKQQYFVCACNVVAVSTGVLMLKGFANTNTKNALACGVLFATTLVGLAVDLQKVPSEPRIQLK